MDNTVIYTLHGSVCVCVCVGIYGKYANLLNIDFTLEAEYSGLPLLNPTSSEILPDIFIVHCVCGDVFKLKLQPPTTLSSWEELVFNVRFNPLGC